MKPQITFFVLFLTLILWGAPPLHAQSPDSLNAKKSMHKTHLFIDKDGDGYNDNAPDDDGDGIPNSLDPDWYKKNKHHAKKSIPYIDENGDGINDYLEGGNTLVKESKKENHMKMHSINEMDKTGGSINSKMSETMKSRMKKGSGKR